LSALLLPAGGSLARKTAPANAETDWQKERTVILQAMNRELKRSKEKLKLENFDPPYFISYLLSDHEIKSLSGSYGTVYSNRQDHRRQVYAEVRVGDYQFDNSGTGGFEFHYDPDSDFQPIEHIEVPVDDDLLGVRDALWGLTDIRYKAALNTYHQKKGQMAYQLQEDATLPDFTHEQPSRFQDRHREFRFDAAAWAEAIRQVTGYFRQFDRIFSNTFTVTAEKYTYYHVNSEGGEVVEEQTFCNWWMDASSRADDGLEVSNFRRNFSQQVQERPDLPALMAAAKGLVEELLALRQAPALPPYNGPAILAPQVSGVLFHEAIGHRLEGERMRNPGEGFTFKGKVGEAVIPTFLTVTDDPTQAKSGDTWLAGYYQFDQEGVPARKVVLIQNGILRNYLMSRTPIKGFDHSNGHGRSDGDTDPMARMGNLIVTSTNSLAPDALKQKLLELVKAQGKPFGLIIRETLGGETRTRREDMQGFRDRPRLVYKVDPETGAETLVRGVELVGTPLISINKIVATGTETGVFNGYCGAESGYVPVSTVTPSTLLQEVELQKSSEKPQRPPILKPPFFEP
jgi:predicted Zn-dependent protease